METTLASVHPSIRKIGECAICIKPNGKAICISGGMKYKYKREHPHSVMIELWMHDEWVKGNSRDFEYHNDIGSAS